MGCATSTNVNEWANTIASYPIGNDAANEDLLSLASPMRGSQVMKRKLIFLDVDGPLACWKGGQGHAWAETETLDDAAYSRNFQALLRVINGAGGVDVVKVVISSNWRTYGCKYTWLVKEMREYGVEVVGHTDVICVHPANAGDVVLCRDLEIQRVLKHRILGAKGLYVSEDGTNAFEHASLPESWEITHWIAIDDLDLASPQFLQLGDVQYLSRFMPTSSDHDMGKGWMSPPNNFADATRKWLSACASSNFVKVDPYCGLGGTRGAEMRAVQLLGGQCSCTGVQHPKVRMRWHL